MGRLENKVALVTGAARGIGEAVARAFAAEGARCYVTDIDEALGRAVAASIGGHARYLRLDVREEADWQAAMAQVLAEAGRLDALVNNAGITGFEDSAASQNPEQATLEDWRRVHRTNLDGTFLGCKHAIRTMRATGGGGSIINISSRSGVVGVPGAAAYASSKAGIRNHTKTVALYCAEQGLPIRCNSIHPAAILTPMWEPMLGSGPERERRMAEFSRANPSGRFGRPDEVAALCVMLASDEATYMTGSELTIDGGILAGSAVSPAANAD
ncbi:glucose 1-dehydrogenase [Zoogloea sp.]|uniref:glucose 1-dehydrogenase n=1 Tax=Zoogloea sp. TaxID=49181 RepID=UPI0035B09DB5